MTDSPRKYLSGFVSLVAVASMACLPSAAFAQSGSGGEQDDPTKDAGHVCLERSGFGPDGTVEVTKIKVLSSREAFYSRRGFTRTNCGGAAKWLRISGQSYCALADIDDPAFLAQFLSTHGLTPLEISDLVVELPGNS